MTREFLKNLGLADADIDKVLNEASSDIGREKAKREAVEKDLEEVRKQLGDRDKDLEELRKSAGDAEEVQKKLDELQEKYDTDTKAFQDQLDARNYADAMTAAISKAGIKFSSKAAEKAFRAELKEKALTVKDGALDGFDDFLKGQRDADPDAFALNKPPAGIVGKVGSGGDPGSLSAGARAAQKFNAQYVPESKE